MLVVGCVPPSDATDETSVRAPFDTASHHDLFDPATMSDAGIEIREDENFGPDVTIPDDPGSVITPPDSEETPEEPTEPEEPPTSPEDLLLKSCGDGILQIQNGEQCDPGFNAGPLGEGCDDRCQILAGYYCEGEPSVCTTKCGDHFTAGDEICDDGNMEDGDGCDAVCDIETGFECVVNPNLISICTATCGDARTVADETCDDGNNVSGDGCSETCTIEVGYECDEDLYSCTTICGDGIIVGSELCDDANLEGGDGCDSQCVIEADFTCLGEPSTCAGDEEGHVNIATCGDGFIDFANGAEVCDDGNTEDGDGCDHDCQIEPDFSCAGEPSICVL